MIDDDVVAAMEEAFEKGYRDSTATMEAMDVTKEQAGAAIHGALTAIMVIAIESAPSPAHVGPMISSSLKAAFKIVNPEDSIDVEVWDISESSGSVH